MLRAFKATFLVAIDVDEIDPEDLEDDFDPDTDTDDPDHVPVPPEPTIEDVRSYLQDALILDYDQDEYGNPVGVLSVEVDIDSLEELDPSEVEALYSHDRPTLDGD